jgi:putative 4-mercaptohistidine N1-methyltranferase
MTTERSCNKWRTDPRLRQTRTILLDTGHAEEKRAEIRQYFHDTYDIDESLLEILKYDETFYLRADPLRHPLYGWDNEFGAHSESIKAFRASRCLVSNCELKDKGFLRHARLEEGELVSCQEVKLSDLGLEGTQQRVSFQQADACNLKALYAGYDLVLATNLIDRLYSPGKFLGMIHERFNPGGLLVIASPYTWDEEFTEKHEWLGGIRVAGEPFTTLEGLHECLAPEFTPVGEPRKVPFVMRETQHKFQHTLSAVTVWERRG